MAEEQQVETVEVKTPTVNPFDDSNWADKPVEVEQKTEVVEEKKPTEEVKQEEFEVVDADVHLKTTLGYDSWEAAKEEIESLKKLREAASTKEEIKFINDRSRQLFEAIKEGKDEEVYEILDAKRKLSAVDKLSPSDILKLHIEQTNKNYKQVDIADVFEEKYAYPDKPIKGDMEEDTDFNIREQKWNDAKEKIDRRIERDAFTAKQELAKLNSELALPDIKKEAAPTQSEEDKQKELQRLEEVRSSYLKVLDSDYTKFNGFEVKVKDGEIEIPITYGVPDNQRVALKDELKNFDVDEFISSRWFNPDGSPNITQTMEDIYLLRNKGDVFQKIANDAGAKRLEHHLKNKSNIDVTNQNGKTFSPDGEKNEQVKMAEFFFNQS